MSRIAAVLQRDGYSDPAAISDIAAAMMDRGREDVRAVQCGTVALGFCGLTTLPEDESQPIVDDVTGNAIVFDGRIDGRATLACSDARAVLTAFASQGEAAFRHLLGEYAFALWDAGGQRLYCVRDVFGLRPLYYRNRANELVVASELQAVLRGAAADPNPGFVAETLTCTPTSLHETLFRDVYRVPPGHMLVADRSGVSVRQVARLEIPEPLVYKNEADYFAHFRHVLDAAVKDRLRTTTKVAVMLSGGIDSATVYATARQHADVNAYTVAYDDELLDESRIAAAVVALNGGQHICVSGSAPGYDYVNEITTFRDLPVNPSGANSARLRERARADDVGVLLDGVGGDEGFFGHSGRWTDFLAGGNWVTWWRETSSWHRGLDAVPWSTIARTSVAPLLPTSLKRALGHLRHRPAVQTMPWIAARFARATDIDERLRQQPCAADAPSHALRGMLQSLASGAAVAAGEEQERLAARFLQDERMPYFDRRVIDFALAIPETLRSRPGRPKYITREAFRDRLPAAVVHASPPPDYTAQWVDALNEQGGAARFRRLAIAEAGWVDQSVVDTMTHELFFAAPGSRQFFRHVWPLWTMFTLDQWYRTAVTNTLSTCRKTPNSNPRNRSRDRQASAPITVRR